MTVTASAAKLPHHAAAASTWSATATAPQGLSDRWPLTARAAMPTAAAPAAVTDSGGERLPLAAIAVAAGSFSPFLYFRF